MTIDPIVACRSKATPSRRTRSAALAGCLAAVLALPAFAGPGLAADSADQLPQQTSVTQSLAADPARLSQAQRNVLFASDVNALIEASEAVAAQAGQSPAPAASADGASGGLLKRALALLGTPYRWGGSSPESGFDCSGLVGYVFRTTLGIELPRISREMARNGERVERAALNPGDLVFFSRRGRVVDHVGIYVGEGRFVHAPSKGKDVMVSELDTGYWSKRFMQARRVIGI